MKEIIRRYVNWRSSGTGHIKPPLGYHPIYCPKPYWWIAIYRIKYIAWKIECFLFYYVKGIVK